MYVCWYSLEQQDFRMRKQITFVRDFSGSSDEELWHNFKEGNKDALTVIFLQHYDSLLGYASRIIVNKNEGKDLIQELFLKLWNSRSNLGNCDNIKFYLLQSIRRLIIDQYQKKKRPLTTEIDENLIPAELPFDSILIDHQDKADRTKHLKKAFSQLSKRQQEAIYLRYYQQLDYPAISEIMAVNIQSVRNLVHSAIQQLKQQLGNVVVLFLSFLKKVKK